MKICLIVAYTSDIQTEVDAETCEQLQTYFQVAVDICGLPLVKNTLLGEHSCEEYFESISELRRRAYTDDLNNAKDELQNVLFLRNESVNMKDMMSNYQLEDKALMKYNIALAQLYNYLLQPFLDIRELAFSNLKTARHGLSNPNYGERRKREYADMFSEWQHNYIQALDSIQQLYVNYYKETNKLQQGMDPLGAV